MDESQEQLLKRLALLKQKIREQYPELSERMADEHVKKLREKEKNMDGTDRKASLVPLQKNNG